MNYISSHNWTVFLNDKRKWFISFLNHYNKKLKYPIISFDIKSEDDSEILILNLDKINNKDLRIIKRLCKKLNKRTFKYLNSKSEEYYFNVYIKTLNSTFNYWNL